MAAGDIGASDVRLVIDRYEESRKWKKLNWYDEFTEVFRALKLRTKPIYRKDSAGRETSEEDKTQTNVCMPGPNIAWRRGVARMTASPYRLKYRGPVDDVVTEMLSALARQQYDRSGEARQDRRVVMSAKAFGVGYGKLFWATLARTTRYRKALVRGDKVVYRDRASIMRFQGAPEDEIAGAVQQLGPQMDDTEIADAIGKSGEEITVEQELKKYEGPCLKNVFIGDLYLMPQCLSLDDSEFAIESYRETDLWMQKMKSVKYLADDGQTYLPAFDPKMFQALLDLDPEPDVKIDDLKQWFLSVEGKQDDEQYQFPKRLRVRKSFDILEEHCLDDDGRVWARWVSPKMKDGVLGKMPYPWDLSGKTTYSELVPLEDMVSPYGDSTVRLMRFLHALDNRTVAQNIDLVTNIIKRFVLTPQNFEMSDEIVTRGNYRQLGVSDINKIKVLEEPGVPPGAFEREAMIQRRMAQLEPTLNTVDSGTESNPLAGKLATTAMLNAKAADSLTQFEIDGRDLYLKDLGEKKLRMNQEAAQEAWKIPQQYWGEKLSQLVSALAPQPPQGRPEWALSDETGKVAAVRLDWPEIQVDLDVDAESMSYLSVDDELRQSAAMRLGQLAAQFPGIVDTRKVVRFAASTIRNLDGSPDDYILPEQPPNPAGDIKKTVSANFPMDKMPSDIVNQVLPLLGMQPSEELAHRDTVEGVKQLNEAGKAANELTSPVTAATDVAPPQPPNGKPPNGKPPARGSKR